jgi:hypothetical protein
MLEGFIEAHIVARECKIDLITLSSILKQNTDKVDSKLGYKEMRNVLKPMLFVAKKDIEQIKELVESYKEYEGYEEPVEASTPKPKGMPRDRVYLGEISSMGIPIGYKVGVSYSPAQRAATLNNDWKNVGIDLNIEMKRVSEPTHSAYKLEAALHVLLEHTGNKLSLDVDEVTEKIAGSTEFFLHNSKVEEIVKNVCTQEVISNIHKEKECNL